MVNFTIYKTNSKEPELKKLIEAFAPIGGGYTVREYEKEPNIFIFTEVDRSPAKNFFVLLKKNELWLDRKSFIALRGIEGMLVKNGIRFKFKYKYNKKIL